MREDNNHQEHSLDTVKAHGLTTDEYRKINRLLNRNPNITELGIFSACLLYTSPSPRDV